MGCSNSKASSTRGAGAVSVPQKFPARVEDQAQAFENELRGTRQVTETVPAVDDGSGECGRLPTDDHSERITVQIPLNPLAVELAQQYRKRRDVLLEYRHREWDAVVAAKKGETAATRAKVLGDRAPDQTHQKTEAEDGGEVSGEEDAAAGAAPVQEEFAVLANKDLAQARAVGFTAEKVAQTVKLFAGWLACDVAETNRQLEVEQQQQQRGSRRKNSGRQDTSHQQRQGQAVEGDDALWSCTVKLELRGAEKAADAMLQDALEALEERLATEASTRPPHSLPPTRNQQTQQQRADKTHVGAADKNTKGGKVTKAPGNGEANAADDGVSEEAGGSGVLFITAAFSFPVEGSYDRKQPWQMEICFFFVE